MRARRREMQSAVGMVWGVNVLSPYSHSAIAVAIVGRARERLAYELV